MKDMATAGAAESVAVSTPDGTKPWNSGNSGGKYSQVLVRLMRIGLLCVGFAVLSIYVYNSASPFGFQPITNYFNFSSLKGNYDPKLERVLKNASMEDKTVIITTLNDAWAEPGSIFDVFLDSFHNGNQTEKLLNHLVVVTLDQKAYSRCSALHPHCYYLETKGDNFTDEAFFMTPHYLHMMWRRIEFLGSLLKMGYSFVFTDADIMWLRDPFVQFYKDADFQIACDKFNGNSYDLNNMPNGGFNYVRSNDRTIQFYKFWFSSRKTFPNLHDQDVLNRIKRDPLVSDIKLKIRFLSTEYFGGFCQVSRDFNKVCTMHANCCVGQDNKVSDLKILLDDWRKYVALPANEKERAHPSWSVPKLCRTSFQRAKERKNKGR